ncbi:MAG: GtrA family protein [Acidobacteria bacterium]|nr:GtrA family protein [Acidobacteriota bacterium]
MAETSGVVPLADPRRRRSTRLPETVRGLRRWLAFNAVGTMGVAVQLTVLLSLTEALGFDYRIATVLAVESAILHNFVWHERWTWRDRRRDVRGRWLRLAWFNLVTGAFSISSNVGFTALYVNTLGVHYAIANLMAIATCSLLTFVANDRFVFRSCNGSKKDGQ